MFRENVENVLTDTVMKKPIKTHVVPSPSLSYKEMLVFIAR